jgi:hypothetical protein
MSGILTQTVGQCKMQLRRHPENSNQTTDVFTFQLLKLGSAVAQLLSRSSIMTVGTSSSYVAVPLKKKLQTFKIFLLQSKGILQKIVLRYYFPQSSTP